MKFRQLGKTGVLLSELCFGTMTFGGKGYWKAIGQLPEDEATQLVKTALTTELISLILQMPILKVWLKLFSGKALKNSELSHQTVFIATKVRLRMGEGANQVGLSKASYSGFG